MPVATVSVLTLTLVAAVCIRAHGTLVTRFVQLTFVNICNVDRPMFTA